MNLGVRGAVASMVVAACSSGVAFGATWYVRPDGADGADGTNWGTAFQTIAAGVSHAAGGDTVLVSNGTYTLSAQVLIGTNLTVQGFGGWSNTVINGAGVTRCFFVSNANAVVDGFTISNGLATAAGSPGNNGGGVYLVSGTVRNCWITHNRATGGSYPDGAGIWMSGGAVQDSVITWNTNAGNWVRGGAIMMNGNGVVERCVIRGNSTGSGSGGGVSLNQAGDTVRNCLIVGNYSDDAGGLGGGGGVGMDGGSVLNCTIVGNRGIGINRRNGGTAYNCIIWSNATTAGAPKNWRAFTPATMQYCSTTPKMVPLGSGNVEVEPEFVRPGGGYGAAHTLGDYHLRYGTPLIDAGVGRPGVTDDLERTPRPQDSGGLERAGATNDLGCYEFSPTSGVFQCGIGPTSTNGVDSLAAVFTACVAGAPAVTNAVWFGWDFGPGQALQSGADKRVVTNAFGLGRYDVTLTVSNDLGAATNYTRRGAVLVVGRIACVSGTGTNAYPYNTWEGAATNWQDAVDAAEVAYVAGVTTAAVVVADGTYTLNSRVAINQGIAVRSANGSGAVTVKRGTASTRGFSVRHAGAVLDGLTISGFNTVDEGGNTANFDESGSAGGGVLITAGTVRNCVLRQNTTLNEGAGIYMQAGTVQSCLFESNSASVAAGGMETRGTSAFVLNSTFRYNSEPSWGGSGILVREGGTVRNCLFYGNVSSGANGWGAIYTDNNNSTIENCTVVGNQKGGLYIRSGGTIRNCIIVNNSVSNLYQQTANRISYTCSDLPATSGNTNADPQFVSAGSGVGHSHVPGDSHLLAGSPCIETGTNQAWMTGALDLSGAPRILGSRVEMGAYEWGAGPPVVSNNAPTVLSLTTAALNGQLVSTNGLETSLFCYWGPRDGGTDASAWANTNAFGSQANGAYATNVTVASNSMYVYRYKAANAFGTAWADAPAWFLAGEVSVTAPDPTASEVGPDGGLFAISRPLAGTNSALTINLAVGGTASNGVDYTSIVSRVTMPAGVASTNLAVVPIRELLSEGSETVELSLLDGAYLVGDASLATVTIADYMPGSWYVRTDGSDANDGTTWATAFQTLSNAVAHAGVNETVWVSNGVYTLSTQLVLGAAVALRSAGGWSNTVINGNGVTRGLYLSSTGAVVDGFTISNGFASGSANPANNGGGVYMTGGTVQNCHITLNRAGGPGAYPDGAGIWMSGGTVQDCLLTGNTNAGVYVRGGGVYMNGNGLVQRCVLRGNATGSGAGGGVSLNQAGDTVRNCLILGNYADDTSGLGGGGGIGMDGGTVQNCTVVGNRGIGVNRRNGGVVVNSVIANNVDSAGRLRNHSGFSSATLQYCCTTPRPLPAAGDAVDSDPEFVNPGSGYGAALVPGDYHLRYGSPAIDAGAALAAVTNDLERKARPVNGRGAYGAGAAAIDLGAYEADAYTAGALRCSVAPVSTNGVGTLAAVFTAAVAGDASATNGLTYAWDFGDGHTLPAAPGQRVVTNTYGLGRYDVTLAVVNDLAAGAAYTRTGAVRVAALTTYVAPGGGHVYPYATWAGAATNLQAAIDAAGTACDGGAGTNALVLVTNGTYAIAEQLLLSRGVTVRSVSGRDATLVVSSSGAGPRGFYIQDAGAVLDGFTISGFRPVPTGAGSGDEGNLAYGAAVLIPSTGGGTVRNCAISGNTNTSWGGVGTVYLRAGRLLDSVIERNAAWTDLISLGDAVVDRCVIRYNTTVDWGGAGVTFRAAGAVMRNCALYGNSTVIGSAWGTVFMDGGVLENCTVAGNTNGGVYIRNEKGVSAIRNCVIYNNSYTNWYDGPGFTIQYTCTTPLPIGGAGNTAADPRFRNPGAGYGLGLAGANYRVNLGSPAVDAGQFQAWMTNGLDLDGKPRIFRTVVDMGAYEDDTRRGTIFLVK